MLGSVILIIFGGLLILNYTRKLQDANEAKMELLARKSLSPIGQQIQDSINDHFTESMRKHQRKMMGITHRPPMSAEIKDFDLE